MTNTFELKVRIRPREPWSEIAIAQLADAGFDSFVETEDGFWAYAPEGTNIDEVMNGTVLRTEQELDVHVELNEIPYQNWNAVWEAGFDPVYVDNFATILAPFHNEIEVKGLKVVIQPQMSFGTGHHQTTWLMTRALFEIEEMPEKVLDMGTGTGVLAIVAEKLGAKSILAIDIEDWSVDNAQENVKVNGCVNVTCKCGDIDIIEDNDYGLILANINKNVLKSHMPEYSRLLKDEGLLFLSGFFVSDTDELGEVARSNNLEIVEIMNKDEWAAIKLIKKRN